MGYVYIFLTIALTIYGQLIIKWQVSKAGILPAGFGEKLGFLFSLVLNPWIASGLFAAFLAALCWMATLTKFSLNYAYPFMSLTFVGVLTLSSVIFLEALSPAKWIGMGLLVLGLVIGSQKW
jgi:multidrug transporter EmrE-like cation transporter